MNSRVGSRSWFEKHGQRLALKAVRALSPQWRAHTELFVEPYRYWNDWHSGLGDAVFVLYGIARMTRPKIVVEIGSARGLSTCVFALACMENGNGHLHAIDPHVTNKWTDAGTGGSTYDFLVARLERYGLSNHCIIHRKTSQEAALAWDQSIDLLFIDGDHSLDGIRHDFDAFARWVTPDGLVIFHDSLWERNQPWNHFKGQDWYRDDMGVPAFIHTLQAQGFSCVSLGPLPGLTIMHSTPGAYELLRRGVQAGMAASD